MDQKFLRMFAKVVREEIASNREVELEGVGVFCLEHRKQFQQQYRDGRVVMVPPKDTIKFVPEMQNNNGHR